MYRKDDFIAEIQKFNFVNNDANLFKIFNTASNYDFLIFAINSYLDQDEYDSNIIREFLPYLQISKVKSKNGFCCKK